MKAEFVIGAGLAAMVIFLIGLPGLLLAAGVVAGVACYNTWNTRVSAKIENYEQ